MMAPRKKMKIENRKVCVSYIEDRGTQTHQEKMKKRRDRDEEREDEEVEEEEEEEDDDDDDEEQKEEGVETMSRCPICLLTYSSRDRRVTVLCCCHLICSKCCGIIEAEDRVKCPLCRSVSKKDEIKTLKLLSIKFLCKDDRLEVRNKICNIQDRHLSHLFKSLNKVKRCSKKAIKNSLVFPDKANKISIRKKLNQYMLNRDLQSLSDKLMSIESRLNRIWENLDDLDEILSTMPIHYDWSTRVIRSIIQNARNLKK